MTQRPAASSRKFAAELAESLAEVVPEAFTVTASDETVVLHHNGAVIGSTDIAELVEASENLDYLPENLATAARAILSNVQDWITDTTYQPWPGVQSQPNPDAEVSGTTLVMWFGDRDDAVLTLRTLDLAEL